MTFNRGFSMPGAPRNPFGPRRPRGPLRITIAIVFVASAILVASSGFYADLLWVRSVDFL